MSQLRRIDATTAQGFAELPRIDGFRNFLIHGYASVDNRTVWGIIETYIGPLLKALDAILEQA